MSQKLLAEVVIGRINLILQHYNAHSTLGRKLYISLQCLQLEAGMNWCPLLTPYQHIGSLSTPPWVHSLWKALDHYGIKTEINYPIQPIPQEEDKLLCDIFRQSGPPTRELLSINRYCIAWTLQFLSDMADNNGSHIEHTFLFRPSSENSLRLTLNFSEEQTSGQDWAIWAAFWERFTLPGLVLQTTLNKLIHPTHQDWAWFYYIDQNVIGRKLKIGAAYYCPSVG